MQNTSRCKHLPLNHYCTRISEALLLLSVFLAGCSEARKPVAEAPPSPPPVVQADQTAVKSQNLPAQSNEIQAALQRIFKGSVIVDSSREPNFGVGDFNGDLSQDIAVVLKPVPEKITDLNQEFPAWILRDLSREGERGGPRLRVAANDVLLAVIHGYGSGGWREQQATQTYLLKNAVGSGLTVRSSTELKAAGKERKLPRLRGDVISEEVAGNAGFLYYGGSTYSWYDPKTFTGDEQERGMIHAARNQEKRR